MPNVDELLNRPDKDWTAAPPAGEEDILRLTESHKVRLPVEYLDLLRFSNGGCGALGLPPRLFHLFDVDEVIRQSGDEFYREEFPGLLFFGGNGGLEKIAFDVSKGEPYPVVMVDPVAGAESAEEIAPDMARFIETIGLEYIEP